MFILTVLMLKVLKYLTLWDQLFFNELNGPLHESDVSSLKENCSAISNYILGTFSDPPELLTLVGQLSRKDHRNLIDH
jgi:hypothetical protein